MSNKFPISFWNYNRINEYDPAKEVAMWNDCGITVGMVPRIHFATATEEQKNLVEQYLDEALKYDMKMIVWVEDIELYAYSFNENAFRELFTNVYNRFKHPALYGFFVGDEPSNKQHLAACRAVLKISKEIAPELKPYINFGCGMADRPNELYGGMNFVEWTKDLAEDTGFGYFCYGHYDQMVDDNGVESYFKNLRILSHAAENAGIGFWNTQLSSAHYMFRVPSFYDLMWQITTAVACGSKGICWFRLSDRWHSPTNYHSSPIDEYGNQTETYNRFLRANRLFQDEYGQYFMNLKHKSTYFTDKAWGGYTTLPFGEHPIIKTVRATENGMVAFFEDDEGNEYLVLVNASFTKPGVFRPEFDRDQYKLIWLRKNGNDIQVIQHNEEYRDGKTEAHWDGVWLYPGQLNIFRIEKR